MGSPGARRRDHPMLARRRALGLACAAAAISIARVGRAEDARLDVHYQPTGPAVVDAMLRLAAVGADDVVYDLGCGDGRIVIAAARKTGARGVGIDLDPERIREANANAKLAGVADRVRFARADLFATDFREATVVMLYLLPELNLKLRPKLLAELRPGARIVSHMHDMGDWKPEATVRIGNRVVFLWRVPAR
jgi:SAM-dependent methyltransferase